MLFSVELSVIEYQNQNIFWVRCSCIFKHKRHIIRKKLFTAFLFLIVIIVMTNPTHEDYLDRVSQDYGQIHKGMDMTSDMLLRIGHQERNSFWIFSRYTYRFGAISVEYIGCGTLIFFVGSAKVSKGKFAHLSVLHFRS